MIKRPSGGWLAALLLVLAIFAAYLPVWHAGFIWDDDSHLTANPCIVGPLGFQAIWTSRQAVYYPLVLTTFWIGHALWGMNPLPFHLLTVAAHAGCAVLLWRVLRRLQVAGAWLGAALWALHPVQVESAAWTTELKNTQSGLFYLSAILFFLRWREEESKGGRKGWYALALLSALLAIVSKSSTVMLPAVLALCWWWMDGRWRWRNALWLAPFFGISAAASVWTVWEQKYAWGAMGAAWSQSRPERFVIAGKDLWFYLGKLAWPHPLIFIYPRWQVGAAHWIEWLPLLAALAGMALLWRWRPAFFAASYFAISLFPVLDFFNVYFFRYSFVGDHFQYLASMGPLALAGAALAWMARALPGRFSREAICAAPLLLLGMLTWRQCHVYRNMESLWQDTVAHNADCWMAHYNLGDVLVRQGRLAEAAAQYREDVRIDPGTVEGHGNLANVLNLLGKRSQAESEYREVLRLDPNVAAAHQDLGWLLLTEGRYGEAIAQDSEALRLEPSNAIVREYLAWMLATAEPESLRDGPRALALARQQGGPANFPAFRTLAAACAQAGRFDEAVQAGRDALKYIPAGGPRTQEMRRELALYEAHSVYRAAP